MPSPRRVTLTGILGLIPKTSLMALGITICPLAFGVAIVPIFIPVIFYYQKSVLSIFVPGATIKLGSSFLFSVAMCEGEQSA